jgi:hypothetical protein
LGYPGRPIRKYTARAGHGRKKKNRSHPFAASGDRRKGTMTNINSLMIHSEMKYRPGHETLLIRLIELAAGLVGKPQRLACLTPPSQDEAA